MSTNCRAELENVHRLVVFDDFRRAGRAARLFFANDGNYLSPIAYP
jgi:hypothetical protein